MIDPSTFPTHVARVISRLSVAGPDALAETFLVTSYITECVIKTLGIALCAGIREGAPTAAYRFEYRLVHADGLGAWEEAIGAMAGYACAGYVPQDMQPLIAWLTKKRTRVEDQWARDAAGQCAAILHLLGADDVEPPRTPTVRHIISYLVQIRNKTKAHGAVGADFFERANASYIAATEGLVKNCPAFKWEWLHLSVRPAKDNVRALHLLGLDPKHVPSEDAAELRPRQPGLHLRTAARGTVFFCGMLMEATRECTGFFLPNGGFTAQGQGEFIDYASGATKQVDLKGYILPPAPLPRSATEGEPCLDVCSNVFGNLPPCPEGYVERKSLQDELTERLLDKNHTIITLHGRGGIGKTSLALFVAHELSGRDHPPFDMIIWLSARDLELRLSGPVEVRRGIANLDEVARLVGALCAVGTTLEALASLLQSPTCARSAGILLVFDNLETLDDPRGLHKFLDTHTHIPNKVLITSRERAFKADYPIEVGGMEPPEALELLRRTSMALGIEGIVTAAAQEEIIDYTGAHPYVMRVLLGEIAKERRWVPLRSLVPRRGDLLNAVFERSFNKLSDDGRWVFLALGNWRSLVPELTLLVVVGQREIDVEAGIEECLRLSLCARYELADGQGCLEAPELARLFAKKKLEGDPDRLPIHDDIELLRQFGPVRHGEPGARNMDEIVDRFLDKCIASIPNAGAQRIDAMDRTAVRTAELWPGAWLKVAEFRQSAFRGPEAVAYALRRAVEEMPFDKRAWLARARHARESGDDSTRIASLVSAVEADPRDAELIREVAFELCKYLDAHKADILPARRGVYLASVRAHMGKIADQLDATGLSRLAWLFLLEGHEGKAWEYANRGLSKDSTNRYCLSMVERLSASGYRP